MSGIHVVWASLAGGLVGTIALTSGLRIAQEVGLTRMDIPLLLGTAFSPSRSRALVIGYGFHALNGLAFSLVYAGIFLAVGHTGPALGAGLGLAHGMVSGGALLNALLPAVHPRMGTPWTDSEETPLLEPPGFLLANYGPRTAIVSLVLHVVYGTLVGWFAAGL
ncbi:MAG TPA: hypothetical protein VFL66_09060 [Gaiellaceae bacterium]|nr:hypothetical protein [Gaiellaceae bacterium]